MATACYGGARRLSDLLQEQQEPFLHPPRRRSPVEAARRKALLCGGYNAARKALMQWDLAGCFRCGARQRFRRLPRAGDIAGRCDIASELGGGDDALDGGRQLSPVSVLELGHSDDEESPALSHWDDDDKPSTSERQSSPPSDRDHLPGAFFVTANGKIRAMEAEAEGDTLTKRLQRKSGELSLEETERATVSAGWERIAADISRIPTMVALDLSRSAREWSRHVAAAGEEEARRVGQSIEAIIFEELRWETVRNMICLRDF